MKRAQSRFVDINNGYIVLFPGEMLCECAANLPCPNNYYFHYLIARLVIRLGLACFAQPRVIKAVVAIDHWKQLAPKIGLDSPLSFYVV